MKAAEETVGLKERNTKGTWFNEECRDAIDRKNQAKAQQLQRPIRAKEAEYSELRKVPHKICRREKRRAMNGKPRKNRRIT